MITFILNNEKVSTGMAGGSPLVDFIRYESGLTGTKIGCREGDCGACTVLMGTPGNGTVAYKSVVSCLTPLGNAHGKHIVTIEGISVGHLSHVQKAIVDHSATQCGYCTPGFVISLTAESLSRERTTKESAIASVSGNICRCTGYMSIMKAAEAIADTLSNKDTSDPVRWLVEHNRLPAYFLTIPGRLSEIMSSEHEGRSGDPFVLGGGTDMMVQKPEELSASEIVSLSDRKDLQGIRIIDDKIVVGAAVTMSETGRSPELRKLIPELAAYMRLIASEPVRNMATVAGNIANASPIGDMSVMLLALNASVTLCRADKSRTVPLSSFFKGYKKTELGGGEYISNILIDFRSEPLLFNFEKVSRRTHLDIATVNTAIQIRMSGQNIIECRLSAGGVSPVPLFLATTSEYLRGKTVDKQTLQQAIVIMTGEISPISDVRGSAEYKNKLLRHLFVAHFMKLFPEKMNFTHELL
jgi:xanthine dehydrogenase small subunit